MKQGENNSILHSCPSCGSKNLINFLTTKDYFFTQEEFNLDKCENCLLVFTNPIPTPDTLNSYYETENYLSHNSKNNSLLDIVYRTARYLNIRNKYKLVKKYQHPANVLDIGSGTGELLDYFKNQGWTTTGIEPNEDARNFAIDKYGLNILNEERIEQLEAHSFDLIMMWHVLEHVSELNKRLEQIKKLLKHNGIIVIAVPNIDSPDFNYYKEYWAGLDVPRHLYHFSKKSIEHFFNRHSIRLIQVHPMKLDAYYTSLLSEKYKGGKLNYLKALQKGFQSNFKAKRLNNNYSSIIFVARKN